jgi:threonine aldolase
MIDLFSDTKTRPTAEMKQAMIEAEVGDDMSGEDPTVNRLEAMVAEMFGMEAAVYACSGTQSNQMGVRVHCQPGDELLIHDSGHIANYEAGGAAALSGVTVRTLPGELGMLDLPQLQGRIRAENQHLSRTKLVCVENTTNSGGGRAYPLEQLQRVSQWAVENGLKRHMDGARLFNAIMATGVSAKEIGQCVDTISICFSKGLGCPMGSILVGSEDDIYRARRARKLFGGALRQAGIVAASAIYALENNVERLVDDHENAKLFASGIAEIDGICIDPDLIETNLVFFQVDKNRCDASQLSAALKERGVGIGAAGPQTLRACTHLDVSREEVLKAVDIVEECVSSDLKTLTACPTGPYARG